MSAKTISIRWPSIFPERFGVKRYSRPRPTVPPVRVVEALLSKKPTPGISREAEAFAE
jgi:hypothetical protein